MAEDSKVIQVEGPNPGTVEYQPAVQSANTLFHFVNKSEYLFSIIKKMAIVPRYCVEDIDYLDIGIEEIAYPMLCFCGINLHKIQEHMDFYGQYGIAFSKQWGISKGIQKTLSMSEDQLDMFRENKDHITVLREATEISALE